MSVLFIEDEIVDIGGYIGFLELLGQDVIRKRTFSEGWLELGNPQTFELIIMDVMLPWGEEDRISTDFEQKFDWHRAGVFLIQAARGIETPATKALERENLPPLPIERLKTVPIIVYTKIAGLVESDLARIPNSKLFGKTPENVQNMMAYIQNCVRRA